MATNQTLAERLEPVAFVVFLCGFLFIVLLMMILALVTCPRETFAIIREGLGKLFNR
jgi:heme/copper-type cytochrome/quinol oxidase subunit 1